MECMVCKTETDRFNKVFRAEFCESEYCTQQLIYAWGSLDNALNFYRMLYVNSDGSEREIPLNWFVSLKVPETQYTHVDAAKYKK